MLYEVITEVGGQWAPVLGLQVGASFSFLDAEDVLDENSPIADSYRTRLNGDVTYRRPSGAWPTSVITSYSIHYTKLYDKMDALTRLLELEPFDGMIIFVRTKTATVEVADRLQAHGFAAEPLNGDMNQAMRERTIDRLKSGLV